MVSSHSGKIKTVKRPNLRTTEPNLTEFDTNITKTEPEPNRDFLRLQRTRTEQNTYAG